jgi:N-methylhydantoinase B/oxoprolinase/acetone carboxylase alpha subunit
MAVPVRGELVIEVANLARRAFACWQRGQEARRTELRAAIRALPDGVFEGEDWVDDDGVDTVPLRVHVRVEIRGDEAYSGVTSI